MATTYTYTPRVAIVTGAAGDLGKVIARRLAQDGFDLALNDLPEQKAALEAVVAEVGKETGRKVIAVVGDVSVEKDVQALVERTAKELGSVDAMVSNVGIFKALPIDASTSYSSCPSPFALLTNHPVDQETWDKIFSVNVRGMLFCYKYAARQMIAQGRAGRLIGGCSVAGLTGAPLCSAYCASKFAVRGLTQTAGEWACGFLVVIIRLT
jgi:NAD(P)-dependent dehydrogenase (short-subunit alcohol dehydrogenase family)